MKIKEGFIVKNVAGNRVAAATGAAAERFNGIITLNETGEFMFMQLQNDITVDELVEKVCAEFEADEQVVKADAEAFVNKLKEAGILE